MDIQELLDSVDIVDLISQYVDLEEKGGEYWGISPFTNPPEKTPSFSVRRETNRFYCFSSGIGGTAITFLKYYYKCSSAEAIKKLEEYAGVNCSEQRRRAKLDATIVCKKYQRPNKASKTSKGVVLDDDYMSRYEKGDSKLDVWRKEGISDDALEKFQVRYDAFSNRIVYPIRNVSGKIVNIGGRTLDPQWKEKKLRKYTYLFQWGVMDTIYGLFENLESIKRKREIILFEGCKSVLIAHSLGINNCGAILTSHLNPSQMKILAKLGVRVVFALDKEVNIRQDHNINKLKQFVTIEYLYDANGLLDEKDSPVDKGVEVFKKLYESRRRL